MVCDDVDVRMSADEISSLVQSGGNPEQFALDRSVPSFSVAIEATPLP